MSETDFVSNSDTVKAFRQSCQPHRIRHALLGNSKWMLWLFAVLALTVILVGCKSQGLFGWIPDGRPHTSSPECANDGAATTYATLRQFSWAFIVPGILMMIASHWLPPLKRAAGIFIVVGALAAVTPWLLDFARPVLWIGLGIVGLYGSFWLVLRGMKLWRHRNHNGKCEVQA